MAFRDNPKEILMFERTVLEIKDELDRARKKFPMPNKTFKALVEEIGELSKALLDCKAGDNLSNKHVYEEAIQCAVMVIRVLEEGDAETPEYTPHLGMAL